MRKHKPNSQVRLTAVWLYFLSLLLPHNLFIWLQMQLIYTFLFNTVIKCLFQPRVSSLTLNSCQGMTLHFKLFRVTQRIVSLSLFKCTVTVYIQNYLTCFCPKSMHSGQLVTKVIIDRISFCYLSVCSGHLLWI